ncbi:hypothetical protein [Sphingomonas sp.]|uniref:hypothetical protein n=1 Tax=Sphingomonas sp. TaxID=28214 RepID=UPI000DB08204|nr:hypothetical protein [Sphingomonas sp.]PZU09621.1 MAG: hypothetical protein DI605_08065 [Sphingomonas sp.]
MIGRAPGALAVAAALLVAQGAIATPLCRDNKGLFTPCPHEANRTARAILASAPARAIATSPAKEPATSAASAKTKQATTGPMRKLRLCTDSRGLFTPCPR